MNVDSFIHLPHVLFYILVLHGLHDPYKYITNIYSFFIFIHVLFIYFLLLCVYLFIFNIKIATSSTLQRKGSQSIRRGREGILRLPIGIFCSEPGTLSPQNYQRVGRSGTEIDAHLAGISQ